MKAGGGFLVVNNTHRAVPTLREDDKRLIWAGDGLDIRAMLAEHFEPISEGRLDPAVVGQEISDLTFWGAYRTAVSASATA